MSKNNILDDIVTMVDCNYMSDLRFNREKWDEKVKNALLKVDENTYSLENWKEFISYLLDIKDIDLTDIKDVQQAKAYIFDAI